MKLHNPRQSSIAIEAQATYYPHTVSVFIPKRPFFRQPSVDAEEQSSGSPYDEDATPDIQETDLERSIRRTKKRISDYVLCNPFELFVTFTFAKNRQDIDQKRQQMSDWLRNQRKRNGKFDYLIVPEFHKDKTSLHFHALFNGYCGLIKKAINPKTGKELIRNGKIIYDLPEYTLGFTNAINISTSSDDRQKVAFYIKKYITKDMPAFENKQRYWVSKDLKLPTIEDNPEKWYEIVKPDWETENDNGKIMRFNVGVNPLVDMYWEARK